VVILTAVNELEAAVRCMRAGALDYLVKPVERNRFVAAVNGALERLELRNENASLKQHLLLEDAGRHEAFAGIVTGSARMEALFRYVEVIAPSRQPVLVSGETGTGKELVAQAIHRLSGLAGPFTAVNVSGLDDAVFSDTLFGHVKGAFTGAERTREGLVGAAAGGTLFLDEIGDLSETSQVKLLRLLQERSYYPLGSDVPKASQARIVAATHHDLVARSREGRFRRDLYYRLHFHHLRLPPLRERTEDVPLLLRHFLEQAAASLGKDVPRIPRELPLLLSTYHFPGNVRELESMVHDAVARHDRGVLALASFQDAIGLERGRGEAGESMSAEEAAEPPVVIGPRFPTLREVEDYLFAEALRRARGSQGIAAGLLGLSRQAVNKRLSRSR
jgi:DNA-binding NtrC family response regulator